MRLPSADEWWAGVIAERVGSQRYPSPGDFINPLAVAPLERLVGTIRRQREMLSAADAAPLL
jgi:hypothetical protein